MTFSERLTTKEESKNINNSILCRPSVFFFAIERGESKRSIVPRAFCIDVMNGNTLGAARDAFSSPRKISERKTLAMKRLNIKCCIFVINHNFYEVTVKNVG